MEMDIAETEAGERRREHWKLLSSLKTTVEGLLSTNNPNVWSRYGGLQRLHKDMNNILSHGLKCEQVYCKQKDYWRFVWCVRYVSPHLASHVEQFSHLEPVLSSGVQSVGEGHKAERWLLHSLQAHCLSVQLRPLLKHQSHTRKYYNDEAFVLSEPHVLAMLQCLEAVEQNDPRLLALVDTVRLSHLKEPPLGLLKTQSLCVLPGAWPRRMGPHSTLPPRLTTSQSSLREGHSEGSSGAPWVYGATEQGQTDSGSIPQILLTEPTSPVPAEDADPVDGDLDDGPEYLAIGNLGQRRRCDSGSSSASDRVEALAPPTPRRSSFSEVQGGPSRSCRGHTRSLSDTGIAQKHSGESAVDVCRVKDYGPFSTQSSEASTPSSLYMESDSSQHSSMSDGLFRKPSEGQSLISYLAEQDFGSCADLEKENAHFSISESLIAAIELMKCNMRRREEGEDDDDSDCEIQQLKQKIRLRRQQIRRSRLQPAMQSQHAFPSTDSGGSGRSSQDSLHLSDSCSAEEVEECELKDADIKRNVANTNRKSFLSSDSVSHSFLQSNSAESVAMGLLRQFEGMQLPAASELDWLVPEHDAPQKLLPIPDSLPISPDDGEHADIYKLRIRVRGNLEWAPPRPQIIFNIHPAPKRKVIVAKQNYRCAGCGTRIDPDYIKRLRYCEYLGRYFCQCCHENAQMVVPGRVLRKWDFSKYPVSNFARDLLGKIAGDPLFNPNDINSGLYKKVKALETVRLLRVQLFHMKNMFKTCRLAKEVLDEFDALPGHLTEDLHLFSLNDLAAVRHGELAPQLRELLRLGSVHVAGCVLCQAKGFVCEFCGNDKDIIFPYELNKCQRCEGEHPLMARRFSGTRTTPAPSWRDWKFPRARRLARALSQDRREGEGGEAEEEEKQGRVREGEESGEEKEENVQLWKVSHTGQLAKKFSHYRGGEGEGENSGEESERQNFFKVLTDGRLTKLFSWNSGVEEGGGEIEGEQEEEGERSGEEEVELENDEGSDEKVQGEESGENERREVEMSRGQGDEGEKSEEQQSTKEKRKLFKALKVGKLTKAFSKDRERHSKGKEGNVIEPEEEVTESVEGSDKEEKEKLMKVPGVSRLAKAFSNDQEGELEDEEGEGKNDVEEEGKVSKHGVKGEASGSLKFWKAPKHISLSKLFPKGRTENDEGGESVEKEIDGKGKNDEQEGSEEEKVELTGSRSGWRSRRTRKACRLTKGRRDRERPDEAGEREEENDRDEIGERAEEGVNERLKKEESREDTGNPRGDNNGRDIGSCQTPGGGERVCEQTDGGGMDSREEKGLCTGEADDSREGERGGKKECPQTSNPARRLLKIPNPLRLGQSKREVEKRGEDAGSHSDSSPSITFGEGGRKREEEAGSLSDSSPSRRLWKMPKPVGFFKGQGGKSAVGNTEKKEAEEKGQEEEMNEEKHSDPSSEPLRKSLK
ncbi:run domain Beclin-1-interacting and cysteine-rich domain-containing protein-like isoform X2 [Megalops cyprinoides]|uniref:run domain Beclin-1-interacting and cysteine-rich domain-containing protein-like isoform X2 n=1 Tax=Megalops cyprinoides TaxID=118141 RepID=UPI0018654761|nr:run domain Beclin-1-interacting and cysteine-rich domain-containing protein-like isoform X2 [Megalops cyprinoides]